MKYNFILVSHNLKYIYSKLGVVLTINLGLVQYIAVVLCTRGLPLPYEVKKRMNGAENISVVKQVLNILKQILGTVVSKTLITTERKNLIILSLLRGMRNIANGARQFDIDLNNQASKHAMTETPQDVWKTNVRQADTDATRPHIMGISRPVTMAQKCSIMLLLIISCS